MPTVEREGPEPLAIDRVAFKRALVCAICDGAFGKHHEAADAFMTGPVLAPILAQADTAAQADREGKSPFAHRPGLAALGDVDPQSEDGRATMMSDLPCTPLKILYTNHEGKTAIRNIQPTCGDRPSPLWWGSTKWHPQPQFLLRARDLDKPKHDQVRDFAMSGILAWGEDGIRAWRNRVDLASLHAMREIAGLVGIEDTSKTVQLRARIQCAIIDVFSENRSV